MTRLNTALAAAALALASSELMAYQIIGSHYHVEVEPNKFIDQLVLRCEDGKEITVPWQSKLAESCGEDLMGNVSRSHTKTATPPGDEQQKQAMLKQLHGHYKNMPDQDVEFSSGPDGLSAHFTPPMVEILKKYELCRKTHKDKVYCATERDRAMAALSDPPAADAAATPANEPAAAPAKEATGLPVKKPAKAKRAQVPQPAAVEEPRSEPAAPAAAPASEPVAPAATAAATEGTALTAAATPSSNDAAPAAPAPAANPADARVSAEKKIGDDYAACMRNKPKFECEEARSKALADIDRGNKPAKSARAQKRASREAAAQPVAAK